MKPIVHKIRLRGPWQWKNSLSGEAVAFDWKEKITTLLQQQGEDAELRLARSFNRPTGIEPGEQIDLVVAGLEWKEVLLNGQLLEANSGEEMRFPLDEFLQPRNQLELLVVKLIADRSDATAEPPEVRLEISSGE